MLTLKTVDLQNYVFLRYRIPDLKKFNAYKMNAFNRHKDVKFRDILQFATYFSKRLALLFKRHVRWQDGVLIPKKLIKL